MKFTIHSTDIESSARTGILETAHGSVTTPAFMPVGTVGSVKGIDQSELELDIKAEIILGNTYHLFLRPGVEILMQAGGLHKFISWDKPILTDSGGYQVYSLSANRKINEEGVKFKSHIDGSPHFFSPESVIEIQRQIGGDIIMAFDECTPWPCDKDYARTSMHLTHRWLTRCNSAMANSRAIYDYPQSLFPIIQGSTYKDLRIESANFIVDTNPDAIAIGGLSVGEPKEEMYDMVGTITPILPKEKPRYLMGVGTPSNLLENISLGIDMFDCVLPTRNGRNGMLYTSEGIINIKNEKWKNDFSAIDPNGLSSVDKRYSKAYLRHLIVSKERLGAQIASVHNLAFYIQLMKEARIKIESGEFNAWKKNKIVDLETRL